MAHNRPTLEQLAINFANTATVTVALSPGVGGNTDISFDSAGGPQGTTGTQGIGGPQGTTGTQGVQGVSPDVSNKLTKTGDTMTGPLSFAYGGANNNYMYGSANNQGDFALLFGAAYNGATTPQLRGWDYLAPGGESGNIHLSTATSYSNSAIHLNAPKVRINGNLSVSGVVDSGLTVANEVRIQGPYPFVTYYQTDGAANQKYAIQLTDGTAWDFRLYDDTQTNYNSAFTITRDGFQPQSITMTGNVGIVAVGSNEPKATFYRASPFDGVGVGLLNWDGWNSSNTQVTYARLQTEISTNTAGAHTGSFQIETSQAGSMTPVLTANGALVGIGTVSPTYKLDVFNATANLAQFYYGDGTYNPRLQISGSSEGITFNETYSTSASAIIYKIAGTELMRLRGDNRSVLMTSNATTNMDLPALELFSDDQSSASANISLRFHQGNQYYWSMRANASGFAFTQGNNDTPCTISRVGAINVFGGAVWSETVPGLSKGSIHINPNDSTDHTGGAITFGGSDNPPGSNAQAGIYTRSDGSYGTKMYFATSDNYTVGSTVRMSILHNGNVGIGSGATNPTSTLQVEDATARFHVGYNGGQNYLDGSQCSIRTFAGVGITTFTGTEVTNYKPVIVANNGSTVTSLTLQNDTAGALANTTIKLGYGTADGYGWKITSNNNPSSTYAGRLEFWRGTGSYALAAWFDNTGNVFMQSAQAYFMNGATGTIYIGDNTSSTYGGHRIGGSKGGYSGIYDTFGGHNFGMYDSAGNGGNYREANGVWSQYWRVSDQCLGIDGSSTSSSYSLYVSGAIYSTADIVAFSDARLKENVYTIENPLAKVCALRGVNFNRIDDPDKKLQMGVIAQEVLEVVPEVVTHAETSDAEGNEKEEYGVNYGALVGVLIEAVKELNAKVDAQAKLIEELRNG